MRFVLGREEDLMMKTGCLIGATLLLAGCATNGGYAGPSEKTAAWLADFERTGETTECLGVNMISSVDALDERHFLIRTGVNDYYLNEPSGACIGAGRGNTRIQYVLGGTNQLCRNQIVTVVDNTSGVTFGSCGLGSFQKLEEKSEDAS